MALVLDSQNVKNITVVRVTGRIVLGDDLSRLEKAIAEGLQGSSELLLNLAGVDYMDSSGIGALVRHVTAARAKRKKIMLCGLTPNVKKVLNLTRVTDLFQTFDTEEQALAAADTAAPAAPAHGTGPRVLVVDESLDTLAYLRGVLQAEGYQVLASSNFPDARLLINSASILVIGPDKVPIAEGTGGSVADALRAAAPKVPAIFIARNDDAAVMAQDLLAQVRAAAKDLRT
jgi:anti-sigma B factor antagonist